jgi:hypothetical protein
VPSLTPVLIRQKFTESLPTRLSFFICNPYHNSLEKHAKLAIIQDALEESDAQASAAGLTSAI